MTVAAKKVRRKGANPAVGPGPAKDEMFTPERYLERVRRVGPIAVDPFTTAANPTKALVIGIGPWAKPSVGANGAKECFVDGYAEAFSWAKMAQLYRGLVFFNCPYSRGHLPRATARGRAEALAGADVIGLVMSSTTEKYFHENCVPRRSAAVCFPKGRIPFELDGKPLDGARFMSCFVYWGRRRYRFAEAFADLGAIWM